MKPKNLFIMPISFLLSLLLSAKSALAHCPLCTLGAAAAAGGAAYLGVQGPVIGLFVGAFAVSLGWWSSRLFKRQYVPQQKWLLVLLSFLLTMIPIMPIVTRAQPAYLPFYLSLFGGYGTIFNRTYLLNTAWLTGIFGGVVVSLTPWLSRSVSRLRKGKTLPFQGMALTLLLLVLSGTIMQLLG